MPGGAEEVMERYIDPEERARAELYGLISRFFYAPPDPNLLAEIARGGDEAGEDGDGGGLAAAWSAVREACRGAFPAVARQEYDTLFVGVGRAEVTPYLSGYAEPGGPDRYLVRLRDRMAAWQLARRDNVFEVEDHIAGACDVMRWLILEGRPLGEQRAFFDSFVIPGALPFLAAVQNAASANFYKPVAALAVAFLEVEKAAFEMAEDS
jgi:TorA maturation chaperone TorD